MTGKEAKVSYSVAIAAGIKDKGYRTVRVGGVESFSGTAIFTHNGRKWKAKGHGPKGSASHVSKQGWIEFTPLD